MNGLCFVVILLLLELEELEGYWEAFATLPGRQEDSSSIGFKNREGSPGKTVN